MATLPGPATTPSLQANEHLTLRWLARRSALLVVILAAGIGAACCLYAFADDTTVEGNIPAQAAASVPKG